MDDIIDIQRRLLEFESANADTLKQYVSIKAELRNARSSHKDKCLSESMYMIGMACTDPNGKRGAIVSMEFVRGHIICNVKYWLSRNKKHRLSDLKMRALPNIILKIYKDNGR